MRLCKECFSIIGEGEISGECEACCNAFDRLNEFAGSIAEELSRYDFKTFNVGSRVWGSIRALQEYLSLKGKDYDIKARFNTMFAAEIAKRIAKQIHRSSDPEIMILFDLETFSYQIHIKPAFIYGRYIKRVREFSQTRWICGYCDGKGCEKCEFTGKKYLSVEELIATPAIKLFKARDAKLHGAGREDIDARMLGNGRPFVLEIIEPERREIDLERVEREINDYCKGKVVVRDLEYTDARRIIDVKQARHRKVYRAKVVFDDVVGREKLLEALESLKGDIRQRTPQRVSHRRADRIRIRKLFDARLLYHSGRVAVVEFLADAGLYIKELVSGDNGRTEPSLAEKAGVGCRVEKLDVTGVLS